MPTERRGGSRAEAGRGRRGLGAKRSAPPPLSARLPIGPSRPSRPAKIHCLPHRPFRPRKRTESAEERCSSLSYLRVHKSGRAFGAEKMRGGQRKQRSGQTALCSPALAVILSLQLQKRNCARSLHVLCASLRNAREATRRARRRGGHRRAQTPCARVVGSRGSPQRRSAPEPSPIPPPFPSPRRRDAFTVPPDPDLHPTPAPPSPAPHPPLLARRRGPTPPRRPLPRRALESARR